MKHLIPFSITAASVVIASVSFAGFVPAVSGFLVALVVPAAGVAMKVFGFRGSDCENCHLRPAKFVSRRGFRRTSPGVRGRLLCSDCFDSDSSSPTSF